MIPSLIRNLAFFGGLSAMAVGLWWERPSAALIVVGGVIAFGGYVSFRNLPPVGEDS